MECRGLRVTADLSQLLPKQGDSHHAEREKAALAAKLCQGFIDALDGKGLSAAMNVLLQVALDTKSVRPRTRAITAARYLDLALKASDRGMGPMLAQQFNLPGATPAAAGDEPHNRAFYDAVLADPEARKVLLEKLRTATGVAPLPALPPKGKSGLPSAKDAAAATNGKAHTNGKRKAKPKEPSA